MCANPPCLSDYGTRESYATADICSPFISTSLSQANPVTFPEICHRRGFPSPSPWCLLWTCCPRVSLTPHETPAFVSAFSVVATNSKSSISLLKKKRKNIFFSTLCVSHSYSSCSPALYDFVPVRSSAQSFLLQTEEPQPFYPPFSSFFLMSWQLFLGSSSSTNSIVTFCMSWS